MRSKAKDHLTMNQNLARLLKNSLLGTLWCIAGMLLYFFLLHYGNYLRIVAQHPDSLLFMFYDWADAAFFSKVISEGMFFEPLPKYFIEGGAMAGFFPPLFSILTAAVNFFLGDISATLLFLSVALSTLLAYLLVKDWPGWELKLMVFFILFFPPMQPYDFPFLMRLREAVAVLVMIAMFKDYLKLGKEKNLLIGGALLILTQPLSALIFIPLYFLFGGDKKLGFPPDLKLAPALALLGMLFFAVYFQHFYGKIIHFGESSSDTFDTLGCAFTVFFEFGSARFLLVLFVLTPFFLIFPKERTVKWLWAAFLAVYLAVILLSFFPGILLPLIYLVKQDFCLELFPIIAFFSLFPPEAKPQKFAHKALAAILASVLLFVLLLSAKPPELYVEKDFLELTDAIAPGSEVLSVNLFFHEQEQKVYFLNFNFHIMSLAALNDLPFRFFYSPHNQFYDNLALLPGVKSMVSAIGNKDLSMCIAARERLGEKADYLHLNIIWEFWKNPDWSRKEIVALQDREFVESCGAQLVYPRNESDKQMAFLYRLDGGGG